MKKFLSLMLAMIMVMSLVTVGAGAADFTDAADIEYVEAVDLMASLGILSGSDGAFSPKGNLTRGAAAKIITYIAQGAAVASTLTYGETTFPDVPATSSNAPYIAWCAENGIINGYTDGTFGRKDNVSGYAFLKMVLNAMGHYGTYTGAGWQLRVTNEAKKQKLLEGIEDGMITGDPLTRELASKIAFNAMTIGSCADRDGFLVNGKYFEDELSAMSYITLMKLDVVPTYVYVKGGSMLENAHKVKAPISGVIVENGANADTKYTKIGEEYYDIETGLDLLGKTVTLYFKDKAKDTDEAYPVVSLYDNEYTEFVVTEKTETAALKAVLKTTKTAEKVAKLDAAGKVTEKAFEVPAIVLTGDDAIDGTAFVGEEGTLTLVIVDKKVVGVKEALTKVLDKVEKIDTTADKQYITFVDAGKKANGVKDTKTNKVADIVNAYEGMAEGDYVVLTQIGAIYNVEKAATVSGKPTKIDGTTVTINGVAYAQNGSANAEKLELVKGTLSLTKAVTLYLDGQGNYIFAAGEKTEYTADIVYVAAAYGNVVEAVKNAVDENGFPVGDTEEYIKYFAQVVTLDGEKVIYPITAKQYEEIEAGKLYKVSVATKAVEDKDTLITKAANSVDGKDKYLKAKFATFTTDVAEKDELFIQAGDITVAELKTSAIKLTSSLYFADEVTFLWIDGALADLKVEVKTGIQALKNETVKVVYEKDDDGNKLVAYVIIEKEFKADTVYTGDIVYVVADATSEAQVAVYKDGTTDKIAYGHKVYVNGVETEIALIADQKSIKTGFYKVVDAFDGVKKLEALDADTYVVDAEFTMFKSLMTIKGLKTEDIDVTGVKVIDLRDVTTKITNATKLDPAKDYSISVVLEKAADKTGNTIKAIYVW